MKAAIKISLASLALVATAACNVDDLGGREVTAPAPAQPGVDDRTPAGPGGNVTEPNPGQPGVALPDPESIPSEGVTLLPDGHVAIEPEVPEHPDVEPIPPNRLRRRMDLDQLSATVRRVTGGIGWTEVRGGRENDLFEELASTLGRPDFIEITQEDLEPSALFQKFLDDAARSVCQRLMEREQVTLPPERVFFTAIDVPSHDGELNADDPAVAENLRALLLRYHGRQLPAGAPQLEDWSWLLRSTAHVTGDPLRSWGTVCVGLITHPDFYTY